MLKPLLHTTAAIVLAAPAFEQTNFNIGANADESVVVSATRTATPIAQIGSSVTLVTAADIEARQQRDLPSSLQTVPGLFVEQTGGVGGQTSLFMRGTNSNHTKVIVDGIDIADPSNPGNAADIGKYLTGDIASVEVLRGPQSGLYGSDAIGGVINIVTKAGEGPMTLTAQAEGGSFETFNQRAQLGGSANGFHYMLTVDHVHVGATPVSPLSLLAPGVKRNDDLYDGLQVSTKLGYDVTDN